MNQNGWAHLGADGQPVIFAPTPPSTWANVTGFDLADAEAQAAAGWFPLWEDRAALGAGQTLAPPTYTTTSDRMTAVYAARDMTPAEIQAALQSSVAAKLVAIAAEFQSRVAAGWRYMPAGAAAPLIIDIDADGRANLSGMALSALLAVQGVAPWELGRGWVARGGTRIPFDTPQPAIPFALGAAGFYSSLVQHEQDLCDAVKALTDPEAVMAFDVTSGWPS